MRDNMQNLGPSTPFGCWKEGWIHAVKLNRLSPVSAFSVRAECTLVSRHSYRLAWGDSWRSSSRANASEPDRFAFASRLRCNQRV